jgi:hypothetical protein
VRQLGGVFVIAGVLAVSGCQKEEPVNEVPLSRLRPGDRPLAPGAAPAMGNPMGSAPAAPAPAMPTGGSSGAVAGLSWTVPAGWSTGAAGPMRVATYNVPAAAGDAEGGEVGVFFFGPGQGGDITANLNRWYGQIEQPDGRPSAQAAKVSEKTINGVKVTTVAVDGTFLWSPRPMSPDKVKKPGYRLLGAIAEAPEGNVFFKLTAPTKTAAAAGFEAFLTSLRKP